MASRSLFRLALLAGCACFPSVTHAQALSAEDVAALRAEIAALRAQVQALEARVEKAQPAPAAVAPAASPAPVAQAQAGPTAAPASAPPKMDIAWKSGPQIRQGDWSFKPKGRIQFDGGLVDAPDGLTSRSGVGVVSPGFASEARRIRLGGEGTLPGSFGYKLELEFSDNAVDLVDTYVSWRSGGFDVKLGNQNQFQSLDELIGDTTGTVMERAAFTDAFNFERRLGLAVQWSKGPLLVQGGIFTDDPTALSNAENGDRNSSYGVDGRIVFAPRIGSTQLHFGVSGHRRDLNSMTDAGVRYRQRPFVHTSNLRFMDTGAFAASGESHYGLELAAVRKRWHVAGETHWLTADRVGGVDPTFFGGYAEVGYYLTPGDSRAYKDGIFDRSSPKNPVDKGGIGSIQLTLRYDYLDMEDAGIRGGKQNGYIAGLVWSPINYLRFNLNYAHLDYEDAVILANGDGNYGVDAVGLRMEFDY